MNNIRANRIVAQGDVLFLRVPKLPAEATEAQRGGRQVVAHSETGHNHVIDADGCVRFEVADPLVCYLRLADDVQVTHERPWHTHAPITLPAGTWQVRRQREHTPEGWQRVAD